MKEHALIIFGVSLSCLLLCCACGGNGNNKNSNLSFDGSNSSPARQEVPDVPISISLEHIDQFASNIRFNITDEDEYVAIEPTSTYYDAYMSSKRLHVENTAFVSDMPTEYNEYPRVQCFIVNNTNETLSINALNLCVDNSTTDPLPYIHLFAEDAHSNTLTLVNEGWCNWGKATLRYVLLKKGEEFDGQYTKQKTIPYFDDFYRINFLDDMVEMGYDNDGLLRLENIQLGGMEKDVDDDYVFAHIQDDQFETYRRAFYPFEIGTINYERMGFARLYGKLTFSESDHEVEFSAQISLTSEGGFGAGMDEDDAFDVQLKTSGDNYTLRYPYVTSIVPGGSERVALTLMCSQSTMHKMHIEAVNDNGLSIRSKEIRMHYLNPKHSSKNVWQKIKKYAQ